MIQVAELIYIVPEKREAVLQQFLNPSVEEQRVAWTYGIRNKCFYRMNEMILETFDYVGKDFHKDMQEYIDAKRNILLYQNPPCRADCSHTGFQEKKRCTGDRAWPYQLVGSRKSSRTYPHGKSDAG